MSQMPPPGQGNPYVPQGNPYPPQDGDPQQGTAPWGAPANPHAQPANPYTQAPANPYAQAPANPYAAPFQQPSAPQPMQPTPQAQAEQPAPQIPAEIPTQITIARIREGLTREEISYQVEADGMTRAFFRKCTTVFRLMGEVNEILFVRSMYMPDIPAERHVDAVMACNDRNSANYWPKCYADLIERDGEAPYVQIYADHVIDCEMGMTNAQIDLQIRSGLYSAFSFFEKLNEEVFPAEWAAYEAS